MGRNETSHHWIINATNENCKLLHNSANNTELSNKYSACARIHMCI